MKSLRAALFSPLTTLLTRILSNQETIMATQADFAAKITELTTDIAAFKANEQALIDAANAKAQAATDAAAALQAQIDAGTIPDAAMQAVQGIIDGLTSAAAVPLPAPTQPTSGETQVGG